MSRTRQRSRKGTARAQDSESATARYALDFFPSAADDPMRARRLSEAPRSEATHLSFTTRLGASPLALVGETFLDTSRRENSHLSRRNSTNVTRFLDTHNSPVRSTLSRFHGGFSSYFSSIPNSRPLHSPVRTCQSTSFATP